MAKKKKPGDRSHAPTQVPYALPRGSLNRIQLGHSFAEYDSNLAKPNVFVMTPALNTALQQPPPKCFYVGRRGTGKTAITLYLSAKFGRNVIPVLPQLFSSIDVPLDLDQLRDTRQRPFKSLTACFKRALLDEVLSQWKQNGQIKSHRFPTSLARERNYIEDYDFDLRMLSFTEEVFKAFKDHDEREWLRLINRTKEIAKTMNELREGQAWDYFLLIDRIDESWDGSDKAVVLLMALMHASVELNATTTFLRPLIFLRENIFDRVRQIDNEFARLETFVISVDWSRELLLELIERRLNLPFISKLPLGGATWDYFFESVEGASSREMVFDYCQERPRDVLTYCSFALESAQSKRHERVQIEDLQAARRRFSDSRLKDLGDEYQENYPQIQLVLTRFYGLGKEYTIQGITAFIQKLLVDEEVKQYCAKWIYDFVPPDRFAQLMYNIGFFGIKQGDEVFFRSLGAQSSNPPPISTTTLLVIHPSYIDALNIQNKLIDDLSDSMSLQQAGLLSDLPEAINLEAYQERLSKLRHDLKMLPLGDTVADRYEEIVGDIIKLCFFRWLTNVEQKVRNVGGRVIRDWIAANRASSGFWEMIRQRYQATQVIWECKNYADLDADAFHQASYYMTQEIGRFAVLSFRGKVKNHHYEHIKRVAADKQGGIVLLLTDQDLQVFLRQASNGKLKEDHIQNAYDNIVRQIS